MWARKTLEEHARDQPAHHYTPEEFEARSSECVRAASELR
jgi:hypothetical protein